jgi:hypothetical protein
VEDLVTNPPAEAYQTEQVVSPATQAAAAPQRAATQIASVQGAAASAAASRPLDTQGIYMNNDKNEQVSQQILATCV